MRDPAALTGEVDGTRRGSGKDWCKQIIVFVRSIFQMNKNSTLRSRRYADTHVGVVRVRILQHSIRHVAIRHLAEH